MAVSGFMIDMDGTVYRGGEAIDGAPGFIRYLKSNGIPFVFLTNNSSNTRGYYFDKLRRMGFDVELRNVLTSTIASARFVNKYHLGERVFVLATEDVTDELRSLGVNVSDDGPDAVLLTFDRSITYDKINRAYHLITAGAGLIATHPDDLCPTEESWDVDIGPFIRLFESLSGCKAEIIGKPNRIMLEMAASEMGVPEEGTVMVGDRLYTDIKMAADAGIRSVLVLTGETVMADLKASDTAPTIVADSVADIPGLISSGRI